MITAIHRIGEGACGGIAFWYDEIGAPDNMIDAGRVTLINGEKPTPGSLMICGSCGADLSPAALDYLPGEFEEEVWAGRLNQKTKILTKVKSLLRGFVNYLCRLSTKINGASVPKR